VIDQAYPAIPFVSGKGFTGIFSSRITRPQNRFTLVCQLCGKVALSRHDQRLPCGGEDPSELLGRGLWLSHGHLVPLIGLELLVARPCSGWPLTISNTFNSQTTLLGPPSPPEWLDEGPFPRLLAWQPPGKPPSNSRVGNPAMSSGCMHPHISRMSVSRPVDKCHPKAPFTSRWILKRWTPFIVSLHGVPLHICVTQRIQSAGQDNKCQLFAPFTWWPHCPAITISY
jgi:hypothetical protein